MLADNAIFPVALIDSEGTVRWVSSSVERFFGWPLTYYAMRVPFHVRRLVIGV